MTNKKKKKLKAPKKNNKDRIRALIKTGLSAIPIVGGPATEIFDQIVKSPIDERKENWINDIVNRLVWLEDEVKGFKISQLSKNAVFISILMKANQNILSEHQKEKIDAFKNGVVNSAIQINVEDNDKILFMTYLTSFTVLHLIIFKFYFTITIGKGQGIYKDYSARYDLFVKNNPSVKVRRETFISISEELEKKGLFDNKQHFRSEDGSLIGTTIYSTTIGNQFEKFITGHF